MPSHLKAHDCRYAESQDVKNHAIGRPTACGHITADVLWRRHPMLYSNDEQEPLNTRLEQNSGIRRLVTKQKRELLDVRTDKKSLRRPRLKKSSKILKNLVAQVLTSARAVT